MKVCTLPRRQGDGLPLIDALPYTTCRLKSHGDRNGGDCCEPSNKASIVLERGAMSFPVNFLIVIVDCGLDGFCFLTPVQRSAVLGTPTSGSYPLLPPLTMVCRTIQAITPTYLVSTRNRVEIVVTPQDPRNWVTTTISTL